MGALSQIILRVSFLLSPVRLGFSIDATAYQPLEGLVRPAARALGSGVGVEEAGRLGESWRTCEMREGSSSGETDLRVVRVIPSLPLLPVGNLSCARPHAQAYTFYQEVWCHCLPLFACMLIPRHLPLA